MPIPLLIAIDPEHESRIVAQLARHPDRVSIARRPADDAELLAAAHAGHGTIALLTPYFPGMGRDLVARLQALGVRSLCLSDRPEEVRALGVHGVIGVETDDEELLDAIDRLPPDPLLPPMPAQPPETPRPTGTLITVSGTGGAPGRSSIAVNLADEIARSGRRAVLVDADVVAPGIAAALGLLDEASALAALARIAGRGGLDEATLRQHLTVLHPGLAVVTGLSRPERWPEIGPVAFEAVLDLLRRNADAVIVDTAAIAPGSPTDGFAPGREEIARTAVEMADTVLFAAGAEVLGVQRLVAALAAEEPPRADLIVVSRVRSSAAGPKPEAAIAAAVARFAGEQRLRFVPDDRPAFDAALLAACTLAEERPASGARAAIGALAEELLPGRAVRRRRAASRRGPQRLLGLLSQPVRAPGH